MRESECLPAQHAAASGSLQFVSKIRRIPAANPENACKNSGSGFCTI